MKKNLTLAAILIASSVQAQYFQHWYNRSFVLATMSNESFYDGIRTSANYAGGNPNNYYQVGYGSTILTPGGGLFTDEARFVRTNKSGTVISFNTGTSFAIPGGALWLNSHGRAICEINNGLGTGGYLAVGNVESNPINGAVVPGGSDGLFYKINSAGAAGSRYRFEITGQGDYFTDIIASKVSPGTYYICGYTGNTTAEMAVVVSIQASGTVNWLRKFQFDPTSPPSAYCRAYGIAEDAGTGNLMVVGSIQDLIPAPNNGIDGLVFSLTNTGNLICVQSHHVFIDDQYHDIKQKANGMFAITGFVGDGNFIPANFYHTWLTEVNPACGVISTCRYDHVVNGNFNQSKGYAIIERQNTALNYEYYIAGPSYNGTGIVASMSKIIAGGANPPVAWYNYAPQSGLFEGGYGIDFANAAATGPGLRLFSNTNAPAAIAPNNGCYMAKTYFNGATCTNYLPNNILVQAAIPMTIAILPSIVDTIYKRYALISQITNYVNGGICTQLVVAGGVNAREFEDDNLIEFEETTTINLYPNPTEEKINISVKLSENGICRFEAIDITGRSTLLADTYFEAGEQVTVVDVSNLAKGIYTLFVRSNNQTLTKKFVVQ